MIRTECRILIDLQSIDAGHFALNRERGRFVLLVAIEFGRPVIRSPNFMLQDSVLVALIEMRLDVPCRDEL